MCLEQWNFKTHQNDGHKFMFCRTFPFKFSKKCPHGYILLLVWNYAYNDSAVVDTWFNKIEPQTN